MTRLAVKSEKIKAMAEPEKVNSTSNLSITVKDDLPCVGVMMCYYSIFCLPCQDADEKFARKRNQNCKNGELKKSSCKVDPYVV